jgi:hypothetical protein
MSPEGAIVWLRKIQEKLDKDSETSKIIAIDMGIEAIKEKRLSDIAKKQLKR